MSPTAFFAPLSDLESVVKNEVSKLTKCAGADDVSKLLKEVGVSADKNDLKVMIEKVQAKPIHELCQEG